MKLLAPTDYDKYLRVCKLASCRADVFSNFKRNRYYCGILEHVSKTLGDKYANKLIENYFEYLKLLNWEAIRENDKYGNPLKEDYTIFFRSFFNADNYKFSPSTLRYIYTGLQILSDFVSKNSKKEIDIIEIGCGYGGQAKVLYDLAPLFDITIKTYTACDLTEASLLQKRFLNNFNIDFIPIQYENLKNHSTTEYDLCISNYCLGEIIEDIQNEYIEAIVKHCTNVFIIWNTKKINPYLTGEQFENIPEVPQTGTCNVIITTKK